MTTNEQEELAQLTTTEYIPNVPAQGYIRYPTIYKDYIVFVTEDDLWLVSSEGGRAERLTAGQGRVSHPHFSPDGNWLAFVGREEGPGEVYVMPALGGPARRLTFDGGTCTVLGWTPDGGAILYASSTGQFTAKYTVIYAISPAGGPPQQLPVGMANAISYGPEGGVVIGRNIEEPAYWKRYRGGTVGHLWCDTTGSGTFQRLLNIHGNVADPCWVGKRIYFISDHEGVGNIYSCTPLGEELTRHTFFDTFYARHLSTDGERLVLQSAADLYVFNPATNQVRQLTVTLPSQRTQLSRKFVSADQYIDTFALHPQGHALALTTRGKAFCLSNWEGASIQYGIQDGVRYRFLEWLNDGWRLVAICDSPGRETLVIIDPASDNEYKLLPDIEFGRVIELTVCPVENIVAITNHRQELIVVDLASGQHGVLDHSEYGRIYDLAWSPDGRWLAYSFACSAQKRAIKLGNLETGETHFATEPILADVSPAFDPEGRYLYFLGYRVFNPISDNLQFEWSFPRGVQPYAVPLRKDIRSPFVTETRLTQDLRRRPGFVPEVAPAASDDNNGTEPQPAPTTQPPNTSNRVYIDLDGITRRAVAFPTGEARYSSILAMRGRVLFQVNPLTGALSEGQSRGWIESFDIETQRLERIFDNVNEAMLSRDHNTLIYRSRARLRVLRNAEKPRSDSDFPGRETGWIDLGRIKVSVLPAAEWRQMFAEAWRLQREQFWTEDMSGVDWESIYHRYAPLIERVGSRSELSDLIHELQGELGTSHAFEYGGEYRRGQYYRQGSLGVDWSYDPTTERYRIGRIIEGDPSDEEATSPLSEPGLGIAAGDAIIAVNGQRVGPRLSPQELLVNQSGNAVNLIIEPVEGNTRRVVTVNAISLATESAARYRDWVDRNRRVVHEKSRGLVGYIHVPNMGPQGFAEFHRGFLAEYDYPALIIDVRWNGGGNVSSLLLEKLSRRRIGYKFSRWGKPMPYPKESPRGPMVSLTNEHAGSDGDIFSHSFKLLQLGPLIGTRTWGGVVGYTLNHQLVDGTTTTQPEFANWFADVGWDIENYGTEPDIEVDIAPQDYMNDTDPQLERAITEAVRLAHEAKTLEPTPGKRPYRGWVNKPDDSGTDIESASQ
ncbi:tricorn protease [Ktedonobacter sp. SOSP1-52]|uniref:S41 family peptidase n=1 Tax=Ktedonobacter sp. SOSP1-52 TaxID=2778366 RepID=UPI0019159F28|nr:S41 family peptidase [Ktedonobacter sp. SOSP1-52]GHO67550.1 tricorn protease [Ktedonobacter sp. SOSP1-52]